MKSTCPTLHNASRWLHNAPRWVREAFGYRYVGIGNANPSRTQRETPLKILVSIPVFLIFVRNYNCCPVLNQIASNMAITACRKIELEISRNFQLL